jgi:hypothetical protein
MRSHAVGAAAVADRLGAVARALAVRAAIVAVIVRRAKAARVLATFLLVSHYFLLTIKIYAKLLSAF